VLHKLAAERFTQTMTLQELIALKDHLQKLPANALPNPESLKELFPSIRIRPGVTPDMIKKDLTPDQLKSLIEERQQQQQQAPVRIRKNLFMPSGVPGNAAVPTPP